MGFPAISFPPEDTIQLPIHSSLNRCWLIYTADLQTYVKTTRFDKVFDSLCSEYPAKVNIEEGIHNELCLSLICVLPDTCCLKSILESQVEYSKYPEWRSALRHCISE
jgi:hypothetical protein